MATIPSKIEKFSDLEMDAFTTIAQANWQKAAAILEYASKSFPLGMLLFFYASQDELPEQPDPKYWKFCDGTAVSNPASIYDGVTVPDLRGKFFKHPGTGDTFPAFGGSDSINIAHNHGGTTQVATDFGIVQLDDGGERQGAFGPHTHFVDTGAGTVTTIPAYREAQVFMRIA